MVYFGKQNCEHYDNWGRCRIHTAPWYWRWLMPKGRPPCVLDMQRDFPSQDDDDVGCPDQQPYPRPVPPGRIPPAHQDSWPEDGLPGQLRPPRPLPSRPFRKA